MVRPPKTPLAPLGRVSVGAPMERIAIDLMGPMNETERYNRYILVVQDFFTKWVEAYPLPNDQAVNVADVVVGVLLRILILCLVIKGVIPEKMCDLLGIEKTHTTPLDHNVMGKWNISLPLCRKY